MVAIRRPWRRYTRGGSQSVTLRPFGMKIIGTSGGRGWLPKGRPAEIDLEEGSGASGDRGKQAGGLG